jgi:two-component system sensor histidine kinase HydH
MLSLFYLLVALAALALGVRATRERRAHPAALRFAALGALTALTYALFGLYLLTGWIWFRVLFVATGILLPVANLSFIEHFFPLSDAERGESRRRTWSVSLAVATLYIGASAVMTSSGQQSLPQDWLAGGLVFVAFGVTLSRLRQRYRSAIRIERARIFYLGLFLGGAALFTAVEGASRLLDGSDFALPTGFNAERQGSFPPVGALFAGLYLYFLHLVLQMRRLLDLHEISARVVTTALSTLALTVVIGVSVGLAPPSSPDGTVSLATSLQWYFLMFVGGLVFIWIAEPSLPQLKNAVARWVNVRGWQLSVVLDDLGETLPQLTSVRDLTETFVERLYASGRVPGAAFYVYSHDRGRFELLASRTTDAEPTLLSAVAPQPFVEGFEAGRPAYTRAELTQLSARRDAPPASAAQLRVMDEMRADLVLPMSTGSAVLGWLALKDEDWSDGFSQEEITQLGRLMSRAATAVENLRGFEASQEQARLAALGTMAAGLAHEIRNPLAGIKGAAQLLRGMSPTTDQAEFLQVIVDETDRLNKVVTDFLDYARHFELQRAPTDLNQLVRQTTSLLRAQGLPDGIQLVEALEEPLPLLALDGDKLRQVVLNLLRNAVQAMPEGGELRVTTAKRLLGPKAERALVELCVQDSGEGMSAETKKSLFIPFFTTKHDGTGLGLAISQRIVQAHQGELRVESREGEGALFVVSLPVVEATGVDTIEADGS